MTMSPIYGPSGPGGVETIHLALDMGVVMLDTADNYGAHDNEVLVGQAIAGRREEAIVATKCGMVIEPPNPSPIGVNGTPGYIAQACDASLARLGIDTIDLYYLHRPDTTVPIEESIGAMAALVAAGKVRHLGLCEGSADTVRRAHATHPLTAVQSEWSLASRDVEERVVPVCRELGIALVPFSPLGRGLLGGRMSTVSVDASDFRSAMPRFTGENLSLNTRLAQSLWSVAEAHGATAAQVALAWLLAQGQDVLPIPGTRHEHRMVENLGALGLQLSPDEVEVLGTLTFQGARGNPAMLERDTPPLP